MNIQFKKIYEHDMDLLIMEEFVADNGFARIFLNKIGFACEYDVDQVIHSYSDADGESDITIVLRHGAEKTAILIEDKIDAHTMEEQSFRYQIRAEKAKNRGEYQQYFVILVAPEEYHEEHLNDKNAAYEYRVSYEELRNYLAERNEPYAEFKTAMIDFAISEKKKGYQVQEDTAVTAFWKELRKFCKENYPRLLMMGKDEPKGKNACWPEFRTVLGKLKVVYKSQKGEVALEFPKYGDRVGELQAIVQEKMTNSMLILPTGKSASVFMKNEKWIVDFTKDFSESKTAIAEALNAVLCLCEFASKLNYTELY